MVHCKKLSKLIKRNSLYSRIFNKKKKFNILAAITVITLFAGCQFRPLIDPESCEIEMCVNVSTDINVNINMDVENNLIYEWDVNTYGPIYYTMPTKVDGIFYKIASKKSVWDKKSFSAGTPQKVFFDLDSNYSGLFINQTTRTQSFSDGENTYYIVSCNKKTKSSLDFEEEFDVNPNAEEIFAAYEPKFTEGIKQRAKKEIRDGLIVYCYDININLQPLSYIYILQIIIYDDDPDIPMDVVGCDYLALNGVAAEGEVMRGRTTDRRCCIESFDVKPMQSFGKLNVFAEKFTTFGIVDNYKSGWSGGSNLTYEAGMIFKTSDGKEIKGKVNIGDMLKEKPKGGVITIILNNSTISKKVEGEGFNIDIENWKEKEININV